MRSALPLGLSKNSLRSDSISYFVAPIAIAIRDSILLQKIILPINASSCGMFSRRSFAAMSSWLSKASKFGNRRQAFSVVGVKNMACPAIPKRRRKSSVSATFCLSPLPKIGEGFREWSEAPSYEEGVGGDGEQQGIALQNALFLCFVSFSDERNEKIPAGGGDYFCFSKSALKS